MPWRRAGKDPESDTVGQGTQMKFEAIIVPQGQWRGAAFERCP